MTPEERASLFSLDVKANECCFRCINGAGGCEWSDNFEPVPGWVAKVTKREKITRNQTGTTYKILYCPKFEEGDRLLTKDKLKFLRANGNKSTNT